MNSQFLHPSISSARRHGLRSHFLVFYSTFVLFSSHLQALPVSTSSPVSFLSSLPPSVSSFAKSVPYLRKSDESPQRNVKLTQLFYQVKRDGYTLAQCGYHDECRRPRLCIGASFDGPCAGRSSCICISEKTELCDKSCQQCTEYPNETCIDLPGAELEGGPNAPVGICASKNLVLEGIAVERGCDSFPDITPLPVDA